MNLRERYEKGCETADVVIKKLKEENQRLRENATEVFIEEMITNDGIDLTMRSGIAPVFATYVREMLKSQGAENFLNMTMSFTDDEYEKYYMTMGRCNGKTVQEKYDDICKENARLKSQLTWIPVEERLPEDGERVLILRTNGTIRDLLYTGVRPLSIGYTHWLPIPPMEEDV